MSDVLTQRMTVDEFLARPEGDAKLELVDGRVEQHMPPAYDHSRGQARLTFRLISYLETRNLRGEALTELELRIGRHTVRVPDLCFFGPEEWDHIDRARGVVVGPPTLVIEIVSPGEGTRDYVDKLAEYATAGIKQYWIVDRQRHTVETHELEGDAYRLAARFGRGEALTSPLLPGFSLPLAELFGE